MTRKRPSDKERAKKLADEHSILPPAQTIAAGPVPLVNKSLPKLGLPYRMRHPNDDDSEGGTK